MGPFSHYPMCKIKPSCDEKTAYSLTYPFVTYLWFILLELTSQSVPYFLVTIPILWSHYSYLRHMCEALVTNLQLYCDLLETNLRSTCNQPVIHW